MASIEQTLKRAALIREFPFSLWKHLLETVGPNLCRLACAVGRCLLRLRFKMQPRQPVKRSLWAGTPIINCTINARAERLLGIKSDTLVWTTYFITNDFTYDLSRWKTFGPPWFQNWFPWFVLLWACFRYQRFHFYCDRTITPCPSRQQVSEKELAFLRSVGKEIFFHTYGSDIRTEKITRSLGEPNCCTECPQPGEACICSQDEQEGNYGILVKYATAIFAMGDMIEYTPGSRNDLFFWPVDLNADGGKRYEPRYPSATTVAPLRIVHAPNHRGFKGSRYIIAAVEKLRAEGLPIELVLVERVPNRQALELYRTADVVFDQCLIGFHGYFALEALALGKPVMVFIRDPQRYLLAPEECPFLNCPPERIELLLRQCVNDRQRLQELGVAGRRYIEKHFSLEAFAGRLQKSIREACAAPLRESDIRTASNGDQDFSRRRRAG